MHVMRSASGGQGPVQQHPPDRAGAVKVLHLLHAIDRGGVAAAADAEHAAAGEQPGVGGRSCP